MKLSQIIAEASLPLWEFSYPEYEHDPTPKVVVLGSYVHPETGNKLMMGINTRLLNTQEAIRLVGLVNDLATIKDGRIRAKYLRVRASKIFNTAYRTYDLSKVAQIEKSTISSKGPSKKSDVVTPKATVDNKKPVQSELKTPSKPLEAPTLDQDLAKSKTSPVKEKPQSTPYINTPLQKPIDPIEDPLSNTSDKTAQQVDTNKSTGDTNVGNPEKVQKKTQRSPRGLDSLSKRPKDAVQRSDSTVSDLENEEY